MPNISKVQFEQIKNAEYQRGFTAGKAVAVTQEDATLAKKVQDHHLRVFHLHGAAMLVKALHEQLRLAGVPEWNPRRD